MACWRPPCGRPVRRPRVASLMLVAGVALAGVPFLAAAPGASPTSGRALAAPAASPASGRAIAVVQTRVHVTDAHRAGAGVRSVPASRPQSAALAISWRNARGDTAAAHRTATLAVGSGVARGALTIRVTGQPFRATTTGV